MRNTNNPTKNNIINLLKVVHLLAKNNKAVSITEFEAFISSSEISIPATINEIDNFFDILINAKFIATSIIPRDVIDKARLYMTREFYARGGTNAIDIETLLKRAGISTSKKQLKLLKKHTKSIALVQKAIV